MKRPYRPGDLFAVPLPDGTTASGIVMEMAGRAPLLAFFDVRGAPWFVARVDDRPLAVLRWPITGRDTSRRVERALTSDRIEAPEIMERRIHALHAGTTWRRPRVVVRNLRAPFDEDAFKDFPDDGWIQWRDVLGKEDRERVAQWLAGHPRVGVRLYGRAVERDLGIVQSFESLQRAAVQVGDDAIQDSGDAVGVFRSLKHLAELSLEGVPGDLSGMFLTTIQRLRIVARADETIDAADLLAAGNLTSIACFGAKVDNVELFRAMPLLRALQLTRTPGVKSLAWLSRSNVTHLTLEGLTHVDDLSPLATMAHLEHLTIRGMWQFGVDQYDWIDRCARLRGLSIDAGARRKTIEIYRRRPFAAALPFQS
ncbi:MAG TPA: hypothetical protein VMS32_01430 [Verrucomicrobiae bacterium]|jgi:hypothetical protein|nr:hypothetical protein [Verrucomicrobiae bacterium]